MGMLVLGAAVTVIIHKVIRKIFFNNSKVNYKSNSNINNDKSVDVIINKETPPISDKNNNQKSITKQA